MAEIIMFASGKGGTGKTTVAAGVSYALARAGKRVLALDADIGLCNLDISMGISSAALFDFYDVIEGRCELEKAIAAHPDMAGLSLITGPQLKPDRDITPQAFKDFIAGIKNDYDFIIIDCPAGVGGGVSLAAAVADKAVVVTTTDTASIRDAALTGAELRAAGVSDIRLVVNRVVSRLIEHKQAYNIDDVIDRTGIRLIGLVAEDCDVTIASNCCVPLLKIKNSGAAKKICDIASRLDGKQVKLL